MYTKKIAREVSKRARESKQGFYHIIWNGKGWSLWHEINSRATKKFKDRGGAVAYIDGIKFLECVVHGKDAWPEYRIKKDR